MYYYTTKSDYLMHHGRKGQSWGIVNGPPYPLDQTNKEYKKTQEDNTDLRAKKWSRDKIEKTKEVGRKVKQFMYDRFSEYGKDHQAVRDKYINEYKRKGYNETAAQMLAEQKYQNRNSAFRTAAATGLLAVVGIPLGTMALSSAVAKIGGWEIAGNKIKQGIQKLLANSMSTMVKDITPVLADTVKQAIKK
jgi:superfamily II DNA/RNA helicase